MLSFLQYLLALVLASDLAGGAGGRVDFHQGVAVLAVGGLVAVAAGRFAAALAARHGDAAIPRLVGIHKLGRILTLVVFGVWAQGFGGRHLAAELGVAAWPLVNAVVTLAPFLLLRVLWKTSLHPAFRAVGAGPPRLSTQLAFDARQALLPLAPILVVGGVQTLLARADASTAPGRLWLELSGAPSAAVLVSLALAASLLLVVPFVLRVVWGAYPMPRGALRDRFEAYARTIQLRANDILVWPTQGRHMNAAVVGALPGFRYVFVTDALIATLDEDELLAVFAHEAGHAKRGHLPLLLAFTAILALAGFLPGGIAESLAAVVEPIPPIARLVLLVVVWLGLFLGWVSRRIEEEADVYGIETTPAPADPAVAHPLGRALDRIAHETGADRNAASWRHFSIARRVAFIAAYVREPAVRAQHKRRLRLLRWTLLGAVLVGAAAAVARLPRDLSESRTQRLLVELNTALVTQDAQTRSRHFAAAARAAQRAGRLDDALRWYREAATLGTTPDVLRDWGRLLTAAGRPAGGAAAQAAADR